MCNSVFRKLNPVASSRLLSVSSTSSQNIKQPGGKSRFKSSGDVILSRSTNIVFLPRSFSRLNAGSVGFVVNT